MLVVVLLSFNRSLKAAVRLECSCETNPIYMCNVPLYVVIYIVELLQARTAES